ncbi:MAG: DUF4931 domain-containing protein [Calditrichae bacterium]|nr:DUF4931 domain-containing protein [Calditrichia bacterium]
MSELRFDLIHNHNVIVAPERNKRPDDSLVIKEETKNCPFCPGNENRTPPESFRFNDDLNKWTIRAFPNKYPAINQSLTNGNSGYQEVLVETPKHDQMFGEYSSNQVLNLLNAYKNRILEIKSKRNTKIVFVFKNHGKQAGASLKHPHSQIVGLDFLSDPLKEKFRALKSYFNKENKCYYCNLLSLGKTIYKSFHFRAIIPNESRFAYECWIIPEKHQVFYENISDTETGDLAQMIMKIVNAINIKLDNPPFNLVLQNGIYDEEIGDSFHWHLQLIPRLYQLAGFEWATGMFINPVEPEKAASELRKLI